MGLFDTWGRKCALTIQASLVGSDLTNFPVKLDLNTLPSEMFDADGSYPALNGGGDIRFTSDAAGDTRLSVEVVTFVTDNNPANGRAEIYVKVPSVSSSVNTTIYVWYKKAGESQPARDAAYGSEDVWSNGFYTVWHLNESSGTNTNESTSTGNNGTYAGNWPNLVTGVTPGDAQTGDGTGDYSSITLINQSFSPGFAVETTILFDNVVDGADAIAWGYDNKGSLHTASSKWYLWFRGGNHYVGSSTLSDSTWYHHTVRRNNSEVFDGRTNGVNDTGTPANGTTKGGAYELSTLARSLLGTTRDLLGDLAEVRVSSEFRNDGWVDTTYQNLLNNSSFIIEGTPESVGGRQPRHGYVLFQCPGVV